jgi:deoxyribonuclease-4
MAGQGNTLGHRFEHLRDILRGVHLRRRFGVCLDTCHLFAAGYDLRSPDGWKATTENFDQLIGLKHLRVWHLNDSLRERGAHRDRHEHIGKGKIGRKGFRNLVNDPRFADTPMILETPKGPRESDGKDWDRVNASVLRRLQERDYRR